MHRIRRGDQRRNAPGCVAPVALGKVSEKGAQGSMDSFVDQLLMSAPGTLLEACGKEHFKPGVTEHHASHVAALGHQAGRPTEGTLAREQRRAYLVKPRDLGSTVAAGFVADCIRYVLPREKDPVTAKLDREIAGEPGEAPLIVCSDALLQAREGDQPVERSALEIVEAERRRNLLRDGSLSGRGRAVDRDDRGLNIRQWQPPSVVSPPTIATGDYGGRRMQRFSTTNRIRGAPFVESDGI